MPHPCISKRRSLLTTECQNPVTASYSMLRRYSVRRVTFSSRCTALYISRRPTSRGGSVWTRPSMAPDKIRWMCSLAPSGRSDLS
ncbi:unnamed protein product [Mycena citricolor]|uniref:Uncharacterized protein n=1 Tax=Mycena citricolor TaxID=2018698 RepID=A0AAD2K0Q5_9AGAR|nr:unnamed protein product [Mycena citricolor]CAK5282451.1 unnamed protein product [Mycena citricolor]